MNMESIYEYGSRAGFWRLLADVHRARPARHRLRRRDGAGSAIREAVAAMKEAGWEIASHGLKWIDYRDFSPDEERAHIAEAVRIHTEVTGERAARLVHGPHLRAHHAARDGGGRLPLHGRLLRRRPALLGRGAERPAARSCPTRSTPTTCASPRRRASTPATSSSAYLKDSFDVLYAEGETAPKMMSVGLHCRLVGRPGRAAALARFLDYVRVARARLGGAADRHRTPLDGASPARSGHGFRRSTVREVA